MSSRIHKVFSGNKKKLVTFITGGDPDHDTSVDILKTIVEAGADIIEIGMPFSDPMADGPTIQLSSNRAINKKINLDSIFEIAKKTRNENKEIPIILMGYYNLILHYGIRKFVKKCSLSGIDGIIIVDLQPEEDNELYEELKLFNVDLIRLITPNTTNKRLQIISNTASGFLYYVTITGVTGQKSANIKELEKNITNIRKFSHLPIVAGFGINNQIQVSEICKIADGAVVGSSIVKIIEENINNNNKMLHSINIFVKKLKEGTNI